MNEISTTSSFRQVPTSCFKAYDIRGRVPDELNEEAADGIGRTFVTEPLLRLNVETRSDPQALDQHVSSLEALIQGDR